jgi:hypothetical protein
MPTTSGAPPSEDAPLVTEELSARYFRVIQITSTGTFPGDAFTTIK